MGERLIYGLVDPRDGLVRYIGKSASGLQRPKQHVPGTRRALAQGLRLTHKERWITTLLADGLEPAISVWSVPADICSSAAEKVFVALARLALVGTSKTLTNATDGGDGGANPSLETRARMSEASRKRRHTPETKQKIADAGRGRVFTSQARTKISQALRDKPKSEIARSRMSEAKRTWLTYETAQAARAQHRTQAEAAQALGVSVKTFYRVVRRGPMLRLVP